MTQDINLSDETVEADDRVKFHHNDVWSLQQPKAVAAADVDGMVFGVVEDATPDGDGDIAVTIGTSGGDPVTVLVDIEQVEVIS